MRAVRLTKRRRILATQLLLGLVLLRAYVPAGYMPQSGHLLRVQLCPAGMSMTMSTPMPAAGHDDHPAPRMGHVADCPFGHSPVAGPVMDGIVRAALAPDPIQYAATPDTRPGGGRVLRTQQARAPPATNPA